jgi:exosortase A-associated hydrolase 2
VPGAAPTPLFIEGPAGRLFAVYYAPAGAPRANSEAVLYLPPFAEEMNRSRRMAALQARALAERGFAVLVLDPYGTGDSEGDFADARWETWRADGAAALDWLRARDHGTVSVLGLRLGACLALDLAADPALGVSRAVLWSPVVRGAVFLTQFLRIRTAAGISPRGGQSGETTKALRARLLDGETLEVAGYPLTPELAAAVERADAAALGEACRVPVTWIEVAAEAGAALAPASAAAVERLRAAGVPLRAMTAAAEPFWAIEETVISPDLIEATTGLWQAQSS